MDAQANDDGSNDRGDGDGHDDNGHDHDDRDFDHERNDRAMAFLAAHGDEPLTPPLIVAGLLVLVWWALLGWQAVQWWPRRDAMLQSASGVASIQRDAGGEVAALLIGDGADSQRFECARRGRWQWRVLYVPLVECRDAALLDAADGREVRVRYDQPQAGGKGFRRLLALTVGGRSLWTLDDSVDAFAWLVWRGALVVGLLLFPGWWLHRLWRPRPA